MSASSVKFSTSDLRSAAKEYQRDRNHNAKWARGFNTAPGKKCSHCEPTDYRVCSECAVRPLHRDEDRHYGRRFNDLKHHGYNKATGQKTTMARKVFRNEVLDAGFASSDSSAGEEDVRDAATAPVPDAGIMYSYDAASGPGKGTDILSHAVTKAVQRYETKVVEKLAKEYEFVDNDNDAGEGYTADEDEFEFIDHNSLE